MNKQKIVVVGSSNMDIVVKTRHIPAPGETLLANSSFFNPGGKGANQAIAVSRLGGALSFVTKLGTDAFGQQLQKHFKQEALDPQFLLQDQQYPTGIALITVDQKGENTIIVAPGSNGQLHPEEVAKALDSMEGVAYILMQLEIPLKTVMATTKLAHSRGIKVVLNPAPMTDLPEELLEKTELITPNETEAQVLTGITVNDEESAKEAARAIIKKGVHQVVITLGAKGALIYEGNNFDLIPAEKVKTVDTTAAGDVFNGALLVALSEGKKLKEAVVFASRAAAISVTRQGAQSSIPYREELSF